MAMAATMPWVVGAAVMIVLILATATDDQGRPGLWLLPATVSVAFLGWTLWAVISVGPFGFWFEHTRNKWSNQIWFDLLFAIAIGWWLIVPRARQAGMNLWFWLPVVLLTGCIGFLAMLARLLYREETNKA